MAPFYGWGLLDNFSLIISKRLHHTTAMDKIFETKSSF